MLGRLMALHPDEYGPSQLRTLQRRVKNWRQRMAKALVYACLEPNESSLVQDEYERDEPIDGKRAHTP